jgi:hypothetical protein
MKIIGIGVKPSKIFDMCSYYSLNRVFLQEDPNTTHVLNNTYAMTKDDKEYFFKDEYKKACAELSILTMPFRKNLVLTDNRGILPTGFRHSFTTDETVFYYNVANKFPLDIFAPFMVEFLKMTILKNWYELKNKYQEVEVIEAKLVEIRRKIKIIVSSNEQDKAITLPYNNGFTHPRVELIPPSPPTVIDIVNVGIFTTEFTEEYS